MHEVGFWGSFWYRLYYLFRKYRFALRFVWVSCNGDRVLSSARLGTLRWGLL